MTSPSHLAREALSPEALARTIVAEWPALSAAWGLEKPTDELRLARAVLKQAERIRELEARLVVASKAIDDALANLTPSKETA